MSFKKRLLAATATIAILAGSAGIAYADSSHVSGYLNTSGSLVKYDYTRTHTYNGPISLSVNDMPSGHLRLGLRNMKQSGGPQFTNTLQWNAAGAKSWDNILRGTRFAFQGRMQACSWYNVFCDNKWGGDLTY
ncbi:hypothetical protein [Arcanobacterium hippocoleae]|uniref:hypothetical protein n=1 Tax=Arcanobacterium hippocoleae TaxID=149017 RepID=UPI00333E61F9